MRPAIAPATTSPSGLDPLTYLSPAKAAARLGIGKTKMLALVRAGRIPCKMLDGRIRISVLALQQFIDQQPDGYAAGKPVQQ